MHEMKEKRKIITIEDEGKKDNLGCGCDKAPNTCTDILTYISLSNIDDAYELEDYSESMNHKIIRNKYYESVRNYQRSQGVTSNGGRLMITRSQRISRTTWNHEYHSVPSVAKETNAKSSYDALYAFHEIRYFSGRNEFPGNQKRLFSNPTS
jgi:hypothetical protein